MMEVIKNVAVGIGFACTLVATPFVMVAVGAGLRFLLWGY